MDQPLTRPCPVCQQAETSAFLTKNELHLVQCARCGMIFVNPVPAQMATGAFYVEAGPEYLSPDKLASDYAPVRFERELRLFRSHCEGGSVLDVGCSSGGFLYRLKERFPKDYEILGTDVSTAPLEHAAKMGVPIARGNFLTYPFKQQFDAVTFWAVMEHLFEPQLFLRRAGELIKPGGVCFILVPNMSSLAVRLLSTKYRYIFPEHLNYFTPKTLKKFVDGEMGVFNMRATHFNPLVIWQDFRKGAREVARAERAQLLAQTNAYKQSSWLGPLRVAYRASEWGLAQFFLADNLVVVARKKS